MDDESIMQKITEVLERVTRVETKIDGYNSLREKLDSNIAKSEVHEEKFVTLDKRILSLEGNYKWIWRTIAAGLIIIVINYIFK